MEILAPAGSPESLRAAVSCGADAVYLGGNSFNARAFAAGVGDLEEAVRYAHLHGTDVHFTLNTVVLDKEKEDLIAQATLAAQAGVDAFIVADLGVLRILRDLFPAIPLHASTQLSIRSTQAAQAYGRLGFTRLVLAREVPAGEVARIHAATDAEIEVFCHGALCVCASGRCLMSSLLGGRSANRGACAQPCRLEYTLDGRNGYYLNMKDLSLAEEIAVLHRCGVTSLKIEGRMKGPLYVAAAVRAYREAVDTGHVSDEAMEALLFTFSRGGFTKGAFASADGRFYPLHPGHTGVPLGRVTQTEKGRIRVRTDERLSSGDTVSAAGADRRSFRTEEVRAVPGGWEFATERSADFRVGTQLLKKADGHITTILEQAIRSGPPKIPADFIFTAAMHRPLSLTVLLPGENSIRVAGPVPEKARTRATDTGEIRRQLQKTGSTPFIVRGMEIQLDTGLSVPKSVLNDLRRRGLQAAEACLADRYPRSRRTGSLSALHGDAGFRHPRFLSCSVLTQAQAEACHEEADLLYIPQPFVEFPEAVLRVSSMASSRETAKALVSGRRLLCGSLLPDMQGTAADSAFNVTNSETLALLASLGVIRVTLSEELNAAQIRGLTVPDGIETEVVAYGHQTLMITENCPVACSRRECRLEKKPLFLTDRKGRSFRMLADGDDSCRVRVLNALPLYTADIIKEISCDVIRLEFTQESPEECIRIVHAYRQALNGHDAAPPVGEYTRGHLRRGI